MNSTVSDKAIAEEVSGLIERVTFHNDENGFCVLRVKVRGHRDEVTVLGSLPSVTAGEWLEAEGWWVRDKEHGLQFKARLMKTVPPTTVEGIERYLSSGLVKGIGPVLAKKLVVAVTLLSNGRRSGNTRLGRGRRLVEPPSRWETPLVRRHGKPAHFRVTDRLAVSVGVRQGSVYERFQRTTPP